MLAMPVRKLALWLAMINPTHATALNFEPSEYIDSTGRKLRAFDMTRDGFMLLALPSILRRAPTQPAASRSRPYRRGDAQGWAG